MASFLSLLMAVIALGHATALRGNLLPQEVYWNTVLPTTPMPSVLHRLLRSGIKNPYVLRGEDVVWHMEGLLLGSYIRRALRLPAAAPSKKTGGRRRPHCRRRQCRQLPPLRRPPSRHQRHPPRPRLHRALRLPAAPRRRLRHPLLARRAPEDPRPVARFSVSSPGSVEAKVIETSLAVCDGLADGTGGGRARCATSLESMVDFAVAKMGTSNLTATSTMAMKEIMSPEKKKEQTYRIAGVRRMGGEKGVVCHPMPYPYAVYYCHLIREPTAVAFEVAAVDEDGTVVDAVATCHMDTSGWNGKHLSVLVLEKPRAPAVCHFLSKDNVVFWAPA